MKRFFLTVACFLLICAEPLSVFAQEKKPLKVVVCEFQNLGRYIVREFGETGRDIVGLRLSHDVAAHFQESGYEAVYPEEVYADILIKKGIGPSSFVLPKTRKMMAESYAADYVVNGEIVDTKKKKPYFGFGVYEGFLKMHVTLSSRDGKVLFETTLQAMGRDKALLVKLKTNEKKVFDQTLSAGAQLVFETLNKFISPTQKVLASSEPVSYGTQQEAFDAYQKGVEAFKTGKYAESMELFQKFLNMDTVGIYTKDAQNYIEKAKAKLGSTKETPEDPLQPQKGNEPEKEKKSESKVISVVDGGYTFTGGTVDFKKGIVEAEGKGMAPAGNSKLTAKSLAKRAAVVDAQRNLLNIISELELAENVKVSSQLEKDKSLEQKLRVFVQSAALAKEEYLKDGSARITLQCALNGKDGLAGIFLSAPYEWTNK